MQSSLWKAEALARSSVISAAIQRAYLALVIAFITTALAEAVEAALFGKYAETCSLVCR